MFNIKHEGNMLLTLPIKRPAFSGDLHSLNFEQILKRFRHVIEGLASTYPKSWKDDFYQEGAMALFDAFQKFIILPKDKDFRPYALKAIKRRMIDFHRKNFDRAPKATNVVIIHKDAREEELIYNVTREPDFFSTVTFGIDYDEVFRSENLSARGFSESEIKAFRLHVENDLRVTDVATELKVSIGQASKILTSLRTKTEELIKEGFD